MVWIVPLIVQVCSVSCVLGFANRFCGVLVVQQQLVPALEHQRCQENKAQQGGFDLCLLLLHTAVR